MKEGEEMGLFLARLRGIHDRLVEVGTPFTEWLVAYQAIRALPEEYRGLVQIVYRWPDDRFKLDNVATELLAEEARLKHTNPDKKVSEDQTDELVFLARKGARSRDTKNEAPTGVVCFKCGKKGHKSPQCRVQKNASSRQKTRRKQASFCSIESNIVKEAVKKATWVYDSAATAHFCNDRKLFNTFQPVNKTSMQVAAKGVKIPVKGKGAIKLNFGKFSVIFHDVLYSPRLRHNLMSGNIIDEKGGKVTASKGTLEIQLKEGRIRCQKQNGLFVCRPEHVQGKSKPKPMAQSSQAPKDQNMLWHRRFGHISLDTIAKTVSQEAVVGMPKLASKALECKTCRLAKSRSVSFSPIGKIRSKKLLELIHTDVAGPLPVPSIHGHRFFVTFTDDYSRFVTVFPMRQKSDVFNIFKLYQARMERLTGERIINVRSDNGAEYLHKDFRKYFGDTGIKPERTNTYTPAQNGVSERFNLTVMNAIRSLLLESGLKKELWDEALMCFEHLWNRVCRRGCDKTPYEMFLKRRPFVGNMKVFGSPCYVNIPKKLISKFHARAREGILVGYARKTKGYRIYLPDEDKVIETCNVRVKENDSRVIRGNRMLYFPPVHHERKSTELPQLEEEVSDEEEPTPSTSGVVKGKAKPINWVRSIVPRKDRTRCDVYYRIDGVGRRYRSHADMERYHKKLGLPYEREKFDFRSKYHLHYPDPESDTEPGDPESEPDNDRDYASAEDDGNIACASL